MKKKYALIATIVIMALGVAACEKKEEEAEKESEISVDISVQETEAVTSSTSQEVSGTKESDIEEIEETSEEYDNKDDVSCYTSKREICEYSTDFPKGVCTDFSYFIYGTNTNAPYIAQKYLEQIGVSEENKRLVVKLADDSEMPTSLVFQEYIFDGEAVSTREHYFFSNVNSYKENVELLADTIEEKNEDAFYICTQFRDATPINYDNIVSLDGKGVYEIIW